MPSPERNLPPSSERAPKRPVARRPKVVEQAKPSFDEELEAVGFDEELNKLQPEAAEPKTPVKKAKTGPTGEDIARMRNELVESVRREERLGNRRERATAVVPQAREGFKHEEERVVIRGQKEAQEEEASRNIEALRKKIESGAAGKSPDRAFADLAARTRQQMSMADALRTEFMDKISAGGMTDADMNRYDNRLMQFRNQLEGLQAETRTVAAPADRAQLETLRNQLFEGIKNLEEALHVAELPPSDATYEAKYRGVRHGEMEMEERGVKAENVAEQLKNEIKTKYGAEPEDLMAGGGLKGLWFRMKNSLSHIAGQESEYDAWRKAKSEEEAGETARLHRAAHERKGEMGGERERREKMRKELEADHEERKRIKTEAQAAEREWVSRTIGKERASSITSEIGDRMKLMQSENPDGYAFTADGYVNNLAHLSEAMQNGNKREIKEYAKTLQDWNKELGYPVEYNPLLGAGASRLKEARVLGARGRARTQQAQEVSRVTGVEPSREVVTRPKPKEEFSYEEFLTDLRARPMDATKFVPNAAQLWDHLVKQMNLPSVSKRGMKSGKRVNVKSFGAETTAREATELILNLAALRKAVDDDNIEAAQHYRDVVAQKAHDYLLENDPEIQKAIDLGA